jgi:hypothetical protein
MLVIGPHVTSFAARRPAVFGDGTTPFERTLDVVARWTARVPCDAVDVVVLEAPSAWPGAGDGGDGDERDLDGQLTSRHLAATVRRVSALEVCPTICDQAAARRDPVIVLAAPRWLGTDHWFSTVRCVIRHASCPVLVAPSTAAAGQRQPASEPVVAGTAPRSSRPVDDSIAMSIVSSRSPGAHAVTSGDASSAKRR